MIDDSDDAPPDVNPSSPARMYRNYLLMCRRLGITPTSPQRAKVLLEESTKSGAAQKADPASMP